MRSKNVLLTVALAAIVSVPAAGAFGWASYGSFEPDNNLDSSSMMWPSAPQEPESVMKRVYFNGFTVSATCCVGIGMYNPNVAALETRNEAVGNEGYVAILGNWVDCNGDGYIGMAETAAREYDAALLSDTTLCPAGSGGNSAYKNSPYMRHNWNGWVTELIPIGGSGTVGLSDGSNRDDDAQDLRVIRDYQAKVWGDFGKPTDDGPESGTSGCPIEPFPKGTWQSTGGALNYVDCYVGVIGLLNTAFADEITLLPGDNEVTLPGPGDPLGLRFTNEDDARSSPLGQISTFGSEDDSHAAVRAFDCSATPFLHVGDQLNSTGADDAVGSITGEVDDDGNSINGSVHDITIWAPSPAPGDTSNPTIPGQLNRTNEETEFNGGGCDTSNDSGRDFYGGILDESDSFNEGGSVDKGKSHADFIMEFEDAGRLQDYSRGSFPASLLHAGQSGASMNILPGEFEWSARNVFVGTTPALIRLGLDTDNLTANPTPPAARYISFYAYVSSATTGTYKVPGTTTGVKYGAAQCGSFTSGKHHNWNCNAAEWNLNSDGTPEDGVEGGNAAVHMFYNLADVDCQDGSNNLGVAIHPAGLGVEACRAYGS